MIIEKFTVDLESGSSYEVVADYEIHRDMGTVGCSLSVCSIKPIDTFSTPISGELIGEIESALAYKIIDLYNDMDSIGEIEGYPC